MSWQSFAPNGKKDHCLYCGRKLRRKHHVTKERTDKIRPLRSECEICGGKPVKDEDDNGLFFKCGDCGNEMFSISVQKVVGREPLYEKSGDYGDGHFCGLRCGYQFGKLSADKDIRWKKGEA